MNNSNASLKCGCSSDMFTNDERFSERSLDRLCNAERTNALVWTSTTGRRDNTVKRLTRISIGRRCATSDADDKRLLNNSNVSRSDSALTVRISHSERFSERSLDRSEERRVGKACRSRRTPYH